LSDPPFLSLVPHRLDRPARHPWPFAGELPLPPFTERSRFLNLAIPLSITVQSFCYAGSVTSHAVVHSFVPRPIFSCLKKGPFRSIDVFLGGFLPSQLTYVCSFFLSLRLLSARQFQTFKRVLPWIHLTVHFFSPFFPVFFVSQGQQRFHRAATPRNDLLGDSEAPHRLSLAFCPARQPQLLTGAFFRSSLRFSCLAPVAC